MVAPAVDHPDRGDPTALRPFWRLPERTGRHLYRQLSELTGHDLMCFCEPDQPCHADTLLRLLALTSPVIAR
jgi:Domain of unknown function (DUF4326)